MRRLLVPLIVFISVLPVVNVQRGPHVTDWLVPAKPTVKAPGDFALVGVKTDRAVRIRTSLTGRHWSSWHTLEPAEGSPSTDPLWVGRARFAQVRGQPPGAKLSFVDPGPDPSTPAATAMAAVRQPGIISRAGWGADESIRRKAPEYDEPVRAAVIHHTATADSYSKSESPRIVRSIYAYHVKTNGWNDIGYNFLVDRYGQIFEGRYGGVTRAVIGAHAEGFNRHTTGISIIGTFARSLPPSATLDATKRIVAWKLDRDSVDPKSSSVFMSGGSKKWPAGTKVRLPAIFGHRDSQQTACPGNPIYNWLPTLRNAVASYGLPKLYDSKITSSVITPNGDGIADAIRATGRFSRTMNWRVDVLDHTGRALQTTKGTGTSYNVRWNGKNTSGALYPHDGYKFKVSGSNSQGSIRTDYLTFRSWRYPNGTLFREGTNGTAYILEGRKLRRLSSSQALASRYRTSETIVTDSTVRSLYALGSSIGFREGSVVRADNKLYVISGGAKRPTTQSTLTALGYNTGSIIDASSGALTPHPTGETLTVASGIPDGAALKADDGREAWKAGGLARPFLTKNVRLSYLIRDVDVVPSNSGNASLMPPLPFRDGSLIRAVGDPTIYVVADGQRHAIGSMREFDQMRYKESNVRTVTQAELALQPQGPGV